MGRPPLATDNEIIEALKRSRGVLQPAADMLGISRKTIEARVQKSPRLQAARDEAREILLDVAEQKLFSQIEEGDFRAIAFTLKCHGKKRGYVERQEVVTTEAPEAFVPPVVREADDAELQRMAGVEG